MSLVEYQPSERDKQIANWRQARARISAAAVVKPAQQKIVDKPVEKLAVVTPADRDWLFVSSVEASGYLISDICREICVQFNVTRTDMESARRSPGVVAPRQAAMALAKHLTKRSFPEIGRLIAGRDHTTVMHAYNKLRPALEACAEHVPVGAPVSIWVERLKAQMAITAPAPSKYRKKAA